MEGCARVLGGMTDDGYCDYNYRFDPRVGRWEALPPLPLRVCNGGLVEYGPSLYYMGGYGEHAFSAAVLRYDEHAARWDRMACASFGRAGMVCDRLGSEMYVLGGVGEMRLAPTDVVEVYDLDRDTWRTADARMELPSPTVGVAMNGSARR